METQKINTAVVILNWNGIDWLKKFLPIIIDKSKIANIYKPKHLRKIAAKTIYLNDVVKFSKKMIKGNTTGKIVIKMH